MTFIRHHAASAGHVQQPGHIIPVHGAYCIGHRYVSLCMAHDAMARAMSRLCMAHAALAPAMSSCAWRMLQWPPLRRTCAWRMLPRPAPRRRPALPAARLAPRAGAARCWLSSQAAPSLSGRPPWPRAPPARLAPRAAQGQGQVQGQGFVPRALAPIGQLLGLAAPCSQGLGQDARQGLLPARLARWIRMPLMLAAPPAHAPPSPGLIRMQTCPAWRAVRARPAAPARCWPASPQLHAATPASMRAALCSAVPLAGATQISTAGMCAACPVIQGMQDSAHHQGKPHT